MKVKNGNRVLVDFKGYPEIPGCTPFKKEGTVVQVFGNVAARVKFDDGKEMRAGIKNEIKPIKQNKKLSLVLFWVISIVVLAVIISEIAASID